MFVKKLLQGLFLAGLISFGVVSALYAEDAAMNSDVIVLKNGSKIMGTVTGSRNGIVTIETDFAGVLGIAVEKISSLQTASSVVIQLADEPPLAEQPLRIQDELVLIEDGAGSEQARALAELRLVNPEPWELGLGYKWTGKVSLAMLKERGNTDIDELDYSLESTWRSRQDRYRLRYNGENDKNNNETTVDKWYAQGKYDYFFEGPNYGGVQASAEHDKFADLDLRYLLGPFLGRQFYEEPIFTFSAELGASYVNENFVIAEDKDYPAATWALNGSSNYLGGDSRLYVDQRGILSLDEPSDYVVDTTFGLAFPLFWSLEAAAELLLEYDAGAVEGVDKLDQIYRFRVGYTW